MVKTLEQTGKIDLPFTFKEVKLGKSLVSKIKAIKENYGKIVIVKDSHQIGLYYSGKLKYNPAGRNKKVCYTVTNGEETKELFYCHLESLLVKHQLK